ncbi:phosphorylated adapter RNA export protein [Adelges cooleyi]|uniref:phosphorylated adapter RNA export protein n=1 Tax=Adelges cooleyi TaxID=133065 RepID=UPI0021805130|nr:phosphorylated adapter RNA export protein [Adelges cooleyi]XP_050424945.1 phosphorylated adapter RNA export protein [Adelges cooleyi]XP_050424946.1 phosphorylated adapter RNA export protein [Adelges cooleyi]XP_050424947.1 phosphorylated adapter RNA export protein [Adelges cooleyi]XP_050424948.1 phosphorylated adapter RNA export protein [Adelges cooleyi]
MDLPSQIIHSDNESDPDELILDTDNDFIITQEEQPATISHKIGSVWRDIVVGEQIEGCLTRLEVTTKTSNYTDMDDPNYRPTENERKRKLFLRNKSNQKVNTTSMENCDLESNHVIKKKRLKHSKDDNTNCSYKYNNSKGFIDKRDNGDPKQKSRILPKIKDSIDKTIDEFSDELCTNLHENNKILMLSVISKIDKKIILEKYNKTCLIEVNGGQMIKNGGRRRTSGGIFFNLIKEDKSIPNSAKKDLFGGCQNEELKRQKKKKKEIKRRINKQKLQKFIAKSKLEENNEKPEETSKLHSDSLDDSS